MERETQYLIKTLAYNRKLLDDISCSGLAWCYNTKILYDACDAIEAELRRRSVL